MAQWASSALAHGPRALLVMAALVSFAPSMGAQPVCSPPEARVQGH